MRFFSVFAVVAALNGVLCGIVEQLQAAASASASDSPSRFQSSSASVRDHWTKLSGRGDARARFMAAQSTGAMCTNAQLLPIASDPCIAKNTTAACSTLSQCSWCSAATVPKCTQTSTGCVCKGAADPNAGACYNKAILPSCTVSTAPSSSSLAVGSECSPYGFVKLAPGSCPVYTFNLGYSRCATATKTATQAPNIKSVCSSDFGDLNLQDKFDEIAKSIPDAVAECSKEAATYAAMTAEEKATYKSDTVKDNTDSCPLKPAAFVAPSADDCKALTIDNYVKYLSYSTLQGGVTCTKDAECEANTCYTKCTKCFDKAKCDGELKADYAVATEKVCVDECPAIRAIYPKEPSCSSGSKLGFAIALLVVAAAAAAIF